MPRVPTLPCSGCYQNFGGEETLKRHRVLAGDRFRCLSPQEMQERNYYFRDRAWHRGASLLPATTASLFDVEPRNVPTPANVLARGTDPLTSKVAARSIAYRTGSAKARLLAAYLDEPSGLTDEEAATRAGMDLYQATKRCADLRRDGAIIATGVRDGRAGLARMVCRVSA
jgi:hypothetical protein